MMDKVEEGPDLLITRRRVVQGLEIALPGRREGHNRRLVCRMCCNKHRGYTAGHASHVDGAGISQQPN